MKRIAVVFFVVVLILPSLALAGDRGHRPRTSPSQVHHGGYSHGGNNFLAGMVLGTATWWFWDTVNHSWRQSSAHPSSPPPPSANYKVVRCYEDRTEDVWTRDRYGNAYVSHTRSYRVEVPCGHRSGGHNY